MSAITLIDEAESRRGLRCRVRISHGQGVWRGVTRVASISHLSVEVHDQLAPTFSEGDAVALQVDSAVLGQMTVVAKVTSLTIQNHTTNDTSAHFELETALQNDASSIAFQARLAGLKPLILSVGACEMLRDDDFPGFRMDEEIDLSEVARLLEEDEVAVLVFGPKVKPLEIRNLLQSRSGEAPGQSVHVVLYDETPPSAFQALVNDDQVFYLAHASIAADELRATIVAAVHHYTRQKAPAPTALTAKENMRLTDLCLSLTQQKDLQELASALSMELLDLLQATQARCLFYDPQKNTLSLEGAEEDENELISAAAGLVGYVARTGQRVRIELATKDPRFDTEADNPGCTMETHFIAQPLNASGGATMGVFTATRGVHLGPFTLADEARIEALAVRAEPLLQVLLMEVRARQASTQGNSADRNVFRQEALDYQDHVETNGKLLWGVPLWLTWSHWLIVLFLSIGIAYVLLAKVHEVVTGPAVIRVTNKITVLALSSGVVATVVVVPGDRVMTGDLMATLQGEPGDSLLTRMREEVRAPADGIVSDVNIRAGQAVAIGDQVLSLCRDGSSNEVLALLPGSYAPQIHVGMPLVLKIDGYSQSREELTILYVAPDIVGPNDAARYVGKEIAQTLSLNGPILIVRTTLPQDTFNTFESANEKFNYHDGMVARAEVNVRKEPLITALVPGIKQLYDDQRISLDHAGRTGITNR